MIESGSRTMRQSRRWSTNSTEMIAPGVNTRSASGWSRTPGSTNGAGITSSPPVTSTNGNSRGLHHAGWIRTPAAATAIPRRPGARAGRRAAGGGSRRSPRGTSGRGRRGGSGRSRTGGASSRGRPALCRSGSAPAPGPRPRSSVLLPGLPAAVLLRRLRVGLRLGLGLGLGLGLRGGRLRVRLRLRRPARLLPVVGLVEARALEDDAGARAEEPHQPPLPALRALLQRGVRHRLELLEEVLAGGALVLVGRRHGGGG